MLYIALAALLVLADQLFKAWIVSAIPLYETRPFLPGVLQLTQVHNEAAAFSMFGEMMLPIIILTFLVCIAIIVALVLKKPAWALERLALALVLGGAVGNLIDRLVHGYVVDMFQTTFINFPVFNIADCGIVVGGILFCLCVLLEDVKGRKKPIPVQPGENEAVFDELKKFEPMMDGESGNDPTDRSDN